MVVTIFYSKSGKTSNAMQRVLTYLIQQGLRVVIPHKNILNFRLNFLVTVASSSWRNLSQKSELFYFHGTNISYNATKISIHCNFEQCSSDFFLNLLANLTITVCSASLLQFFLWLFFFLIFKPAKYPIPIKTQRSKQYTLHFYLVVFALFLSRSSTDSFFFQYIVLCGLSWGQCIVNT